MTQLPGDGSCTTQQQPDISATAPPGGVKKRKLSSSSDSVNESTPQKVIEIKSEFRHGWIIRVYLTARSGMIREKITPPPSNSLSIFFLFKMQRVGSYPSFW